MTPTEIKALARAYAEHIVPPEILEYDDVRDWTINEDTKLALSVLQWLSDTHCIVPKSKVAQEYRNCMSLAENHPKPSERTIAKCVADELKAVFGKDMFEDKEEEV